jgi:RNA polymerase sigma-70 factor (ECF subfamily)
MAEWAIPSAETLEGASTAAESRLVAECRLGNPEAFARLVAVHERMVYNLAARLLGDAEEARDLAQDVFLQIYRTLPRFEGRSTLKTWIYRIVVNQCANRRRLWSRRRRAQSFSIDEIDTSEEARLSAAAESPESTLGRRESARRIQRALQRISFEHRAILLLREAEELSCEEIAQTLGIPVGTVKSRLARARDSLRLAFGDMDGGAS